MKLDDLTEENFTEYYWLSLSGVDNAYFDVIKLKKILNKNPNQTLRKSFYFVK